MMKSHSKAGRFTQLAYAVAMCAALVSGNVLAQAYPSRTITVISNLGGAIDNPVRLVMEKVKENTGANAIIEPRPGANGALGLGAVRRAAPTLGEHNDFVLGGMAGMSAAQIAELRRDGIIGERLKK